MKQSLLTLALSALTLTATASVPATFQDCAWETSLGGGKMDYEIVTESDGSEYIRMTPTTKTLTSGEVPTGARYFRTANLGSALGADYKVFAFEYKITSPNNCLSFYFHQKNDESQVTYPCMTVSDEWQTAYCYLSAMPSWWSDSSDSSPRYHWVVLDNWAYTSTDFTFCVKNLRYLTVAEAEAEYNANAGTSANAEQGDMLTPSTGAVSAYYDNIQATLFITTDANPLLITASRFTPIAENNTYFAYDYSCAEDLSVTVYLMSSPGAIVSWEAALSMPASGSLFVDYKTFSVNLKEKMEAMSFAKAFGSNNCLWLQFANQVNKQFAVRNVRWSNYDTLTGINEIEADETETNGVATFYNLQGQQVANPTNGLYIKKQGNKTSKVLVK